MKKRIMAIILAGLMVIGTVQMPVAAEGISADLLGGQANSEIGEAAVLQPDRSMEAVEYKEPDEQIAAGYTAEAAAAAWKAYADASQASDILTFEENVPEAYATKDEAGAETEADSYARERVLETTTEDISELTPTGTESEDATSATVSEDSEQAAENLEEEPAEIVEDTQESTTQLSEQSEQNENSSEELQSATAEDEMVSPAEEEIQNTTASSDYQWVSVDSKTVKITGYTGADANLILPSQINSQTVVSIGEGAFYDNQTITSVKLPSTVTEIEAGAFAECRNLTAVTLGDHVQTIDEYAFQMTQIASVTLPGSLKSVDGLAFYLCLYLTEFQVDSGNTVYSSQNGVLCDKSATKLLTYPMAKPDTNYSIPEGIKTVAEYAFYENTRLQTITIPSTVTTLSDWCFNSTQLTSVTIPDGVTTFGYGILQDCKALRTAVIGKGVKELPYLTFSGCSSLVSVSLENGITKLNPRVFYGCTSLTQINFPSSLQEIWVYAFYGCTSLSGTITLPDSLNYVQSGSFEQCTANIIYPSVLMEMENGDYRKMASVTISGKNDYNQAYQVLTLVNNERTSRGLSALKMDSTLLDAAMIRSYESAAYFSHTRPSGADCFTVCNTAMGENIAYGSATASGTMNQWMNSAGHKANILSTDFTSIGIGCFYQNGTRFWVQLFGNTTANVPTKRTDVVSITRKMPFATTEVKPYIAQYPGYYTFFMTPGSKSELTYAMGAAYLNNTGLKLTSSDSTVVSVSGNTITATGGGTATLSLETTDNLCKVDYKAVINISNGWHKINGSWYYYKNNTKSKGWLKTGGVWYYLDSTTGKMATGWVHLGKKWYYMNPSSGALTTSWKKIGSKWYLFKSNNDGQMLTGWQKSSGKWYYLDLESGAMKTGWLKLGKTYYYLNSSGVMCTGWKKVGSCWYYMKKDGAMEASKWIGNYYVKNNGAMLTNNWTPDGYYVDASGKYQPTGYKLSGSKIILPDATLTLPTSWKGNIKVKRYKNGSYAIIYKDIKTTPYVFLTINRYNTQEAAESALEQVDSPKTMGENGHYIVIGAPTDTTIGYYTTTQKKTITTMLKSTQTVVTTASFLKNY